MYPETFSTIGGGGTTFSFLFFAMMFTIGIDTQVEELLLTRDLLPVLMQTTFCKLKYLTANTNNITTPVVVALYP